MASSPSSPATAASYQEDDLQYRDFRVLADGGVAQATTVAGDWGYNAISTATTTVVKSGAGQLGTILVLGGTMGAITVYDNTAASGTLIAAGFTPVTPAGGGANTTVFNCSFGVGLTIVTGTAMIITVLYR